MTTYNEVTGADTDVAVFLAHRLDIINIWRLPLKAWVARQDGEIVAVLAFTNVDYPAIHFMVANPATRPFMRLIKLWLMAYEWCKSIKLPLVCAPVYNHLRHFQSIIRRLGFRKIGEERDANNQVVEVIYGYHFNEEQNEDSLRTAE